MLFSCHSIPNRILIRCGCKIVQGTSFNKSFVRLPNRMTASCYRIMLCSHELFLCAFIYSMRSAYSVKFSGGGARLKSRSCRTGAGVGRRVRDALGSTLPLGTGSACLSSFSLPSLALTVIESKPARSLAGPSAGSSGWRWWASGSAGLLQARLPPLRQLLIALELFGVVLKHPEQSGGLCLHVRAPHARASWGRAL